MEVSVSSPLGDSTQAGAGLPSLAAGVITSSSFRDVRSLARELRQLIGLDRLDLFLLREADIKAVRASLGQAEPIPPPDTIADILKGDGWVDGVFDWIVGALKEEPMQISALATYFPGISSVHESRRESACYALATAVKIALKLSEGTRSLMSRVPVVEIVCGSRFDRCNCETCLGKQAESTVFEYRPDAKVRMLLKSLRRVRDIVYQSPEWHGRRWVFALEYEPGDYLLDSVESMQNVVNSLSTDEFDDLSDYVGFNIDIAHFKIGGVSTSQLRQFSDQVVHMHISDHPRSMHTHDQSVGSWTNVIQGKSDYQEYFDWLTEVAHVRRAKPNGLPFTGTVAIELEGCNRILEIVDSVSRVRFMIQKAQSRYLARKSKLEQ